MQRILTFLFTLSLFLLYSSTLPIYAANPSASLNLSPDKKFATVSFSNLKTVTKVNYTLTYQSLNRTTGVEGSIRNLGRINRTSRRQILGTCSTRRCVYHPNPKGFKLEATFHHTSGQKTTLTKSL